MHGSPTRWLFIVIAIWFALVTVGPLLVGLLQAVIPLVVAIGAVVVIARLIWFFTDRY